MNKNDYKETKYNQPLILQKQTLMSIKVKRERITLPHLFRLMTKWCYAQPIQ